MMDAIEKTKKIDEEYNYLTYISEDIKGSEGRLEGIYITVKDCICVKDTPTQSSSRILEGYKPLFDATVIEKVKAEGGMILGKTVQDEFGFGGFSNNVGLGFKRPLNPFDKERSTGGSSGGSGGFSQAADFPHVSLGESTGGSIVSPASLCGVYGLCPTYGRVSRYGLLDYANSLDKIGPMSKDLNSLALVQEVISGHDAKESTSIDAPVPKYTEEIGKDIKGMKIALIKEGFGEGIDPEVAEIVRKKAKELEEAGAIVEEVSLPLAYGVGLSTYYIIAQSESSTNLAKFCGMRYGATEKLEGSFNEYFSKVRSTHFGKEAKRRILLGTFTRMVGFRDAYYVKAMKVRTKIIEEYKKAFSKYDALVSPAVPYVAPRFDELEKMSLLETYMADVLTVGPNLAGLPHLNCPAGFSKSLPVGLMLVGDHLEEGRLIRIGSHIKND